MSFTFTDAALGLTGICPSQKLTLSIFAKHANNAGICWPSNQKVARETGFDERTVRRHTESLKRMGLIERTIREGRSAMTRIVWAMLAPKGNPGHCAPHPGHCAPLNLSRESEYQITAGHPDQGTDPTTSTAIADIVVFDSVKARVPEAEPVPAAEIVMDKLALDHAADQAKVEVAPADPEVVPASQTIELLPFTADVDAGQDPVVELSGQDPVQPAEPLPANKPAIDLVQDNPLAEVPATDDPLADCPPEVLADFGLARQKKGRSAIPTSTELKILGAQGAAVGLTVAQVIMLCAGEGWAWFQSTWATPPVMERFRATWMPGQAPAMAPQRFYQPEVVQPASPSVKAAAMAAIAVLRAKIKAQPFERMKSRSPG